MTLGNRVSRIIPRIETYLASDGDPLYYRDWTPAPGIPRARVVALHGIQSHSGWYEYSSRQICAAGFELCFLDRRGSGMNERNRGHTESHTQLIDDVATFLTACPPQTAGMTRVPTILLGVSWGGKLAAAVAAAHPEMIQGLALLYPGLQARVRASRMENFRLSLAERLGIRSRRIPIPLEDPELFTTDLTWQDYIRTDPLALRDVTVSFLLANRQLDRMQSQLPAAIHCPVLLQLAGQDRIIDNVATRRLVERFATSDRTILEYHHAQHTLEFEPDRNHFIGDLILWINRVTTVGDH